MIKVGPSLCRSRRGGAGKSHAVVAPWVLAIGSANDFVAG